MPLQMLEARASVLMELIVDKLMLLDYHNEFCNKRKPPWPPLHKFYFSMPCSTRNEQFSYFLNLVSWLLSLNGRKLSIPQEPTDSNAACNSIMHHLKELGFVQPSWAPAKLRQGFGDAVCSVLDSLTDLALEAQGFRFSEPVYVHDEKCQGHTMVDAADDDRDKIRALGAAVPMKVQGTVDCSLEGDMKKKVSLVEVLEQSKKEVEHLASQHRISVGNDGKDWRTHFSEAEKLYSEIREVEVNRTRASCLPHIRIRQLIEDDISFFLEKLETRESFLNKQFELLVSDYSAVKSRFMEVQERCDQSFDNIASLAQQLENTSNLLDDVKQKLVEKGNQISDISPLLEIRNGIHTLKAEIKEMKVHVGVLEHTLLQNQMNHNMAMKSSRDIITV